MLEKFRPGLLNKRVTPVRRFITSFQKDGRGEGIGSLAMQKKNA